DGMRAREDDLRAAARQLHVDDVRADAIALAIALARDLLLLGQDRVGASQIDDDVLLLEALDGAGRQLALAILELLEDAVALGVAHALDDVLVGRLGRDTAELLGRQLREQLVTDLGFWIHAAARLR